VPLFNIRGDSLSYSRVPNRMPAGAISDESGLSALVAFFARTLARGKHSVSYRLRAEIPGRFDALPARAEAMYAPELRANSDEIRLGVED
jgi:hypothetical protein